MTDKDLIALAQRLYDAYRRGAWANGWSSIAPRLDWHQQPEGIQKIWHEVAKESITEIKP